MLKEYVVVLREGLRPSEIILILWSKRSTKGDVGNEAADVGFVTCVSLVWSSSFTLYVAELHSLS